MIALIGILIYVHKHPRQTFYFAVDNTGHLLEDVPINKLNMSKDEMLDWTVKAVEAVNSYDYVNYRAELQDARKYFNDYGWSNYKKSLDAANNLIAIIQRKIISIARVIERPKIIKEGILYGAYAWRIKMPILVTYWLPPYDDANKFSNALQVSVLVQRQAILQSYQGLSIVQLIESSSALSNQPQEISNTPTG
jgi:intracellular multiplication protein IcmL